MKTLLTLLVLLGLSIKSEASITTATSSGDWDESIWDNGEPGCFDTIVIPATITVTIASTVDLEACPDSMIILVSGTLAFVTGKKLKLPCLSDIYVGNGGSIVPGGGMGNSNYIEMCSTIYWNAGSGTLTGPTSLCDGGCVMLPIELISFTAVKNESKRRIDLNWITLSETDNDYFTVERSGDAQNWTEVCMVDGAGNSSQQLFYQAFDNDPQIGVSYYRLKQTDMNGDYSYSPIVSVDLLTFGDLFIYPNPASKDDQVLVVLPENYPRSFEILIFDLSGKLIAEFDREDINSGQTIITLPNSISAGTYCISIGNERKLLVVQ